MFEREIARLEHALDKLAQKQSPKKLPKKIWRIPNDLVVPRIEKQNKKKVKWKTSTLKELRKTTKLVDSTNFMRGETFLGVTTHGTPIMRTKWGTVVLMNKKTREAFKRAFKKSEFFSALEQGRKLLKLSSR